MTTNGIVVSHAGILVPHAGTIVRAISINLDMMYSFETRALQKETQGDRTK